MCLSPIQRPNPYYDPDCSAVNTRHQSGVHRVGLAFCRPDERYIMVPCNVCPACVAMRQNDITQRAQVESRFCFVWFLTLTYDNAHLPRVKVPLDSSRVSVSDSPLPSFPVTPYDFESAEEDPIYLDDLPLSDAELAQIPLKAAEAARAAIASLKARKKEKYEGVPDSVTSEYMPYADHTHLQSVIRHFREFVDTCPELQGRKFKYLAVSELGGQRGRPHFHVLLFFEHRPADFLLGLKSYRHFSSYMVRPSIRENLTLIIYNWWRDNWAVNVGSRKNPIWEPLYTFVRRPDPSSPSGFKCTFDCHFVANESTDAGFMDVAFYVSKYIMKSSDREIKRKVFLQNNLDDATFAKFWKLVRSRMMISKGFGTFSDTLVNDSGRHFIVPSSVVVHELHNNVCVDAGVSPGPVFIAADGVHRPLARYYYNKHFEGQYVVTVDDIRFLYDNYDDSNDVPAFERGEDYINQQYADFARRKRQMINNEKI